MSDDVDLASVESRAEMYAAARPKYGDPDYKFYCALFNDVTFSPHHPGSTLFSERHRLADYLWAMGWRREMRPDDYR